MIACPTKTETKHSIQAQLGEPIGFIGATYRGMGNFWVILLLRERNLSY